MKTRSKNLKRKLPRKITAGWLRRMGACEYSVGRFERAWPNGVEPNRKNLFKAVQMQMPVEWLVNGLLTEDGMAEYLEQIGRAKTLCFQRVREAYAERSMRKQSELLERARNLYRRRKASVLAKLIGL